MNAAPPSLARPFPSSVPLALPLALLPLVLACGPKDAPVEAAAEAPSAAESVDPDAELREASAREVLAAMNLSADPCTDFYAYACGGWMETTEIPADQASWSRSFSTITERNREILRALLEQAAADPGAGAQVAAEVGLSGDQAAAAAADWQLLGSFYGSCMDTAAVEEAGLTPVRPLLTAIDELSGKEELPVVLGLLQASGLDGLWGAGVFGDLKDPDTNMAYVSQSGLGLPDRGYYLQEDEDSVALQQAYRAYIAQLLEMSGLSAEDATAAAEGVYAFEAGIAEFSLPRDEMRDPERIYNPVTAAELDALAPSLGLTRWAEAVGLPMGKAVSVHDRDWYGALENHVADASVDTLQNYLRFHALSGLANRLPDAWGQARFDFYGKQVAGQQQRKERWKRCTDHANRVLGDALGRHYVARHFAGDSKDIALEMVDRIGGAFEAGLPELAWMDDDTRAVAAEKAGGLTNKIGYPEQWEDYGAMVLGDGVYADSALAAARWHVADELRKAGQPVDPAEWFMPATVVNAYYNPLENEMVFPAGILQPPFFHRALPAPANYGAIGMVIGHELTHGFDDSGRKFDKTGQMTEWWAEEVAERFTERAQCVEAQYSAFPAAQGQMVNGKLTLGENIADMGGIKLAWGAWKSYEADRGAPEPLVEELSNDQLLFVAYAQGWCTKMRPELEKVLVLSDSHSPPRYRVNGPLQNTPVFHEVFQCEAGDAMVREDLCEVW